MTLNDMHQRALFCHLSLVVADPEEIERVRSNPTPCPPILNIHLFSWDIKEKKRDKISKANPHPIIRMHPLS